MGCDGMGWGGGGGVWAYAQTSPYWTHVGQLLDTEPLCGTLPDSSTNHGRNEEKHCFSVTLAGDSFRPHNPLVVCSNHTGPSSIWFRDFTREWLLRGCGLGIPGSGTVSNTVSKRPRDHPLLPHARPDDTNWTAAEIKSCCRLASLLDVPLIQAAQNVVPVAVTAGDTIEALRQWAYGRCLSADRAGVYSRSEGVSGGRGRRVVRAD